MVVVVVVVVVTVGVVVMRVVVVVEVVVVDTPGGVIVSWKFPDEPPKPSTTIKYVCPATTFGRTREATFSPAEFVHESSLHPEATSPLVHVGVRTYTVVS